VKSPDFHELVGEEGTPQEQERIRRVHDMLVAAGPPPELSPELRSAPAPPKATIIPFPRQRWRTALVTVAAALLVAFAAGWAVGGHGRSDHVVRTVAMLGPNGAQASLALLHPDDAGNWPMRMTVSGLPTLPNGHTYTLWLTKHGRLDSPCGTFTVTSGTTTVRLNAPYRLKEYSGWVVVASGSRTPLLRTATV
jgi:hypothetical protein